MSEDAVRDAFELFRFTVLLDNPPVLIRAYDEAKKLYDAKLAREESTRKQAAIDRAENGKMRTLEAELHRKIMESMKKSFRLDGSLSGTLPEARFELVYGVMTYGDHVPSVESRTCYGLHKSKDLIYAFRNKADKTRFNEIRERNAEILSKTDIDGEQHRVTPESKRDMMTYTDAILNISGVTINAVIENLYRKYKGETPMVSYVSLQPEKQGSQFYLKVLWGKKK